VSDESADIHQKLSASVIAVDWQDEIRSLPAANSHQAADHSARNVPCTQLCAWFASP
jgi:hypothetical protein